MHMLLQLPIIQVEYELKDELMDLFTFKSLAYNFLCIHITIKANIILIIIKEDRCNYVTIWKASYLL